MQSLIDLLTDVLENVVTQTGEIPTVSRLEYRDVTRPCVSLKLLGYAMEQGSPKEVLAGLRRQCAVRGRAATHAKKQEAEYASV